MAPYFTMSQDGALHIDGNPPVHHGDIATPNANGESAISSEG